VRGKTPWEEELKNLSEKRRNPKDWKKVLLFLVPLILFFFSTQIADFRLVKRIDNFIYDSFFRWNHAPAQNDIVLVGITQESLNILGKYPWPRTLYATLIKKLTEMGARIIAFDIYFSAPSNNEEEDRIFVESVKKSGRIILPVYAKLKETNNKGGIYQVSTGAITHNLPSLEKNSLGIGHINVIPDEDGVVRTSPLFIQEGKQIYPSLPVITYMRFKNIKEVKLTKGYLVGEDSKIPLDERNRLIINHYSEIPVTFFPFHKVLEGKVSPSYFKEKIVIVGQATEGLPNADILNTPVGRRFGVFILANTLSSLLTGDFIRPVPESTYNILSLVFIYGIFIVFLISRKLSFSIFVFFASLIFLEGIYFLVFFNLSSFFKFMPVALTIFLQLWYTTYLNYRNIYILFTYRETQLKVVEEVSHIAREAKGLHLMRTLIETLGKDLRASAGILREKGEGRKKFPPVAYYLLTDIPRIELFHLDSSIINHLSRENLELVDGTTSLHSKNFVYISSLLRAGDEVVGSLSLYREGKKKFTSEEQRLYATIIPQISVALKNLQLYRDTRRLFIESIQALTAAIDAKDPYTEGHSERVTELSLKIAREMGFTEEELERLRLSALLHDIGKIGIEERILRKETPLNNEEYEKIKEHPEVGARILLPIRELKEDVIPAVRSHHERWDGNGYPEKLKGEEIPLFARIIAVADTFDAMTSDRPYRKAKSTQEAFREILRNSGTQFDPQVVDAFQKVIKEERINKAGEGSREIK